MSWTQIRERWNNTWQGAWKKAQDAWARLVKRDPEKYRKPATETVTALQQTRDLLESMIPKLPKQVRTADDQTAFVNFKKLKERYEALAAGIYADSERVKIGIAPVIVLVVAGVALSVPATAWALSRNKEAKNLLEQTRLFDKELDARVFAMQQQTQLQAPTLLAQNLPGAPPPVQIDQSSGSGGGFPVVPALVVLGLGGAGLYFAKRSKA